jgi:hypothetical protein
VCPKRNQSRDPKKTQLNKLYQHYRPAQHKRPPAPPGGKKPSYADMAKQKPAPKQNQDPRFRPWNQNNLRHKPSNDVLNKISQLNQQLAKAMDLVNAHFAKWDARLSQLEASKKKSPSTQASSSTPTSSAPTHTHNSVPASPTSASSSAPKRTHSDVDSASSSNSEDENVNLKSLYEKDQFSILSTLSSIKNAVQSFATHITGGPHDDEDEDEALEELQDFDEEFEDADDSPAVL